MGRPRVVKRKVKNIASKRVASQRLSLDGDKPTQLFDTEDRFAQISMDTVCGLSCNTCNEKQAGRCFGCYEDCSDDIRNCLTTDCLGLTSIEQVNKDGNITTKKALCGVRCCKRSNLKEIISDVTRGTNDLSIQNVRWEPFGLPNFPSFVPSINGSIKFANIPYVAISLTKVYSEKTDTITRSNIREPFDILPTTKVILTGFCQDPLLETFWMGYKKKGHLERLKEIGFDYSFAFNYSIYHGQPRMEHLINLRRNFQLLEDTQAAGIPVIPDFCWHNDADLDQFIMWLNNNMVKYASISLQLARNNSLLARNIADINKLTSSCPTVKKWIINGPTVPRRIRLLATRIPNMILMNSRCFQLSKFLQTWDFTCNDWMKCVKHTGELISRLEAFERNCKMYDDIVSGNLERFGDYFAHDDIDIFDCDDMEEEN